MRVIAADDQPDVLEALRLLLKREGIAMVPATSPAGVISALEQEDFDAALLDLNYARDTTSGVEGLDLLTSLRSSDPTLPVKVDRAGIEQPRAQHRLVEPVELLHGKRRLGRGIAVPFQIQAPNPLGG